MPTVLDKIIAAVEHLAEPGGASRQAIAKYIKSTDGEVSASLMKKAFATGVAKDKLLQSGQRFSLPGVELAPREEDTVQKTIIKAAPEGSAACDRGDTVDMKYCGTLAEGGEQFDKVCTHKVQHAPHGPLEPPSVLPRLLLSSYTHPVPHASL